MRIMLETSRTHLHSCGQVRVARAHNQKTWNDNPGYEVKIMKLCYSLLTLAIAFSPLPVQPLAAQGSPHPPSAAAKDAFIHQIMEDAGIPGLQAVVVKRDRIVWSNSYGDAVLDVPGPRRLALDDHINRSLPFSVRNPNWPDVPITWRMLLTHTSSIDDTSDALNRALFYWGKDHPLAFDDYVKARFLPGGKYHAYELFRSGKPGSERIYSNDGFSLLAFALEQVTHESFDAYVRREIWTPLKMNESSYSLAGLSPDHLAAGYGAERKADGTFSFVPAKVFWGHESVSGTIMDYQYSYPDYPVKRTYTNARDFARRILMFLNGGTVDGARILGPASVDMIFTPSGYRNLDGWKQGIGVNGPLDLRGRQVWGHDGQGEGSVSALYVNRENGVGAFTIANSNYLDESQNYSLVDLDMHLMAWFEDSAIDRVAASYVSALEKGNGHAPLAATQEAGQSTTSNQRTAQQLSPQQEDVWKGEQDLFRYLNAKDLKAFMSMWDTRFVGWPDYNDRPVRKADIESSAAEEFRSSQTPSQPLPAPQPEAVAVFGDVAVTHYFWPEVDQTSPTIYRITHTWKKGRDGWHIIGGISCPVPRSAVSPSDEKRAVEMTIRSFERAMQEYDFTKADTFYAPEAKWIEGAERSQPELAYPTGQGPFWTGAKANKVRLVQKLHDFDIQIRGDVAWVTIINDTIWTANNEEGRRLMAESELEETGRASPPNQHEWRSSYVESEVLVKMPTGWKIVLGHTSLLPRSAEATPSEVGFMPSRAGRLIR